MDFFSFTPQESKAIVFIVLVLIMGSGVTLYKRYHPDFAPEYLLDRERPKEKEQLSVEKHFNNSRDKDSNRSESKINLNTATLEELISLPGIGKELGRRILTYREKRGSFSRIEELLEVNGIGPKTFEKIKDQISID
ncbi:MAG: ComEA family DNA-binding protein [candidate division Zixibacteria bacterium]|nr:ComEA family DNA-binding protein [candidate division Zixibacteria bacterium]